MWPKSVAILSTQTEIWLPVLALQAQGVQIQHFSEGLHGFIEVWHHPPQLLLLDSQIPELNLMLAIRRLAVHKTAPSVIVLCTEAEQSIYRMLPNVLACVVPPYDMHTLLDCITHSPNDPLNHAVAQLTSTVRQGRVWHFGGVAGLLQLLIQQHPNGYLALHANHVCGFLAWQHGNLSHAEYRQITAQPNVADTVWQAEHALPQWLKHQTATFEFRPDVQELSPDSQLSQPLNALSALLCWGPSALQVLKPQLSHPTIDLHQPDVQVVPSLEVAIQRLSAHTNWKKADISEYYDLTHHDICVLMVWKNLKIVVLHCTKADLPQ